MDKSDICWGWPGPMKPMAADTYDDWLNLGPRGQWEQFQDVLMRLEIVERLLADHLQGRLVDLPAPTTTNPE